ncbi:MAG: lysoplasmalogenase [bacterium]
MLNLETAVLSLIIAAFSVVAIRARVREKHVLFYVFKPLTTVCILFLAVLIGRSNDSSYFMWIVTGLAFCLAGDIFLMFPERFFTVGLTGFLMGHVFYILAFSSDVGLQISWRLLPFAVYGLAMFFFLFPSLGRMKFPVLVYVAVIVVMVWQSLEQWVQLSKNSTLFAFMGAVLFVVSDSVLAINKFKRMMKCAQPWILGMYYYAQWLIALSVGQ